MKALKLDPYQCKRTTLVLKYNERFKGLGISFDYGKKGSYSGHV